MTDDQFEKFIQALAGSNGNGGKKNNMEGWRVLTPILLCAATIANGWVAMAVVQSKQENAAFRSTFDTFKDQMNTRMGTLEGYLRAKFDMPKIGGQ